MQADQAFDNIRNLSLQGVKKHRRALFTELKRYISFKRNPRINEILVEVDACIKHELDLRHRAARLHLIASGQDASAAAQLVAIRARNALRAKRARERKKAHNEALQVKQYEGRKESEAFADYGIYQDWVDEPDTHPTDEATDLSKWGV